MLMLRISVAPWSASNFQILLTLFFLSYSLKHNEAKDVFFSFEKRMVFLAKDYARKKKLFSDLAFFLSTEVVLPESFFFRVKNQCVSLTFFLYQHQFPQNLKKKVSFSLSFNLSRDTATGCAGKKLLKWVEKIIQPFFGHHRRIVSPGNVFFSRQSFISKFLIFFRTGDHWNFLGYFEWCLNDI